MRCAAELLGTAWFAFVCAVTLGGRADEPPAEEKAACAAEHRQGQVLRRDGKLAAAHAVFVSCARDACPAIVRKDCTTWLAEVAVSQPTIVVEARNADGAETSDVTMYIDGRRAVDRLSGIALDIDPGVHAIR